MLKIDGLLKMLRLDQSLLRVFQVRFLTKLLKRLQPEVMYSHLYDADLVVMHAFVGLPTPWIPLPAQRLSP